MGCLLLLWLWVCFAGGIGLLIEGDWATGIPVTSAGLLTLAYLSTPDRGVRRLIRAGVVLAWFAGGLLFWDWTVEDWTVAGRVAFGVLGGTALVSFLAYRAIRGRPPGRLEAGDEVPGG